MRRVPISLLALLAACGEEPASAPIEVRGAPIRSAPKKSAPPPSVAALTGVNLASEAPPVDPPRVVDGYREVKFELLTSYEYEWSSSTGQVGEGTSDERIPANVRELGGKKVLISGYMQPIDFDKDGVRSFLLTNFPGACCFGMIPRLNEWVEVTLPGEQRIDYTYFDPVEIRGVLEVGAAKSGEVVTSLYRMTPDKVAVVPQ